MALSVGEYISENLLDMNFVKLIWPTYTLQWIFGTSSVVMNGKLVSTIPFYQKMYSVLLITIVSASFCYVELTYYDFYYDKEKTLFYTFAFGLFVQYLSYLFNVIHARFLMSDKTVEIFLRIQKIDRDLKRNNLSSLYSRSYYMNRIWIVSIIVKFGGGFALFVYYNFENFMYTIPMGFAVFTVYLHLVLTGSCIYYLAFRLQHLNNIIEKYFQNDKSIKREIKNIEVFNPVLTISVGETYKNISLKDFANILKSILEIFQDTSKIFEFGILNVVVTVFIWTFLVIESTVVGLRTKLLSILSSMVLMLWMFISFEQIIIVAFVCDWFAKQVRDAKALALRVFSVCSEDKDKDIRKSSWELLHLIEFEKPIFSVYGLFNLNMRLPLQLIGVITTNVLVLIQYTSNTLNTN